MIVDARRGREGRLVDHRVDVMRFDESAPASPGVPQCGARVTPFAEGVRAGRELVAVSGVTPASARTLESDLAEVVRS
ncbi:hypothetical protein [Thermasporomyces composti]|jgi:hypothetical protein|uniref:Uncharacterized protein n=1 Tax=Thermasporomyces composti TaxID=696763 RepID=A0A3D9VCJ4_THECX|nr:hypothetical protein [Thermasporomyces composti]REF35894.1 hypothetical protein DFJ64_1286 [Thermasporomyces composti]